MDDTVLGLVKPKNNCPYVIDDEIDLLDTEMNENFHVLHLNIRSFLKNVNYLKLLLDDLLQRNVIIDVVLLCETFVTNDNIRSIGLPGYQCFNKNREDKQGGGILVFV